MGSGFRIIDTLKNPAPAARGPAPLGVMGIAACYAFGGLVLLAALLFNPTAAGAAIAERHGLPPAWGSGALLAVAALAFVMAYGLFAGTRWGFFLAVLYLLYFAAISLARGGLTFAGRQASDSISLGNFTWSALVLLYLVFVRQHFLGPRPKQ